MSSYPDKDCYESLGVDPLAPQEVVDAAWKALVKKFHPDPGSKAAGASDRALDEEKLKEINQAYDFLRDPEGRKRYDAWRRVRESDGAKATEPDEVPPRPHLSPSLLDFGVIVRGEGRTLQLTLENRGGPPREEINFSFGEDTGPFRLVSYDPPGAAEFPKTLQISVDTTRLPHDSSSDDWFEASLDGIAAKARVAVRVQDSPSAYATFSRPAPPTPPPMVSPPRRRILRGLCACLIWIAGMIVVSVMYDWSPRTVGTRPTLTVTCCWTVFPPVECIRGGIILNGVCRSIGTVFQVTRETDSAICFVDGARPEECYAKAGLLKYTQRGLAPVLDYSNTLSAWAKAFWLLIYPFVSWTLAAGLIRSNPHS